MLRRWDGTDFMAGSTLRRWDGTAFKPSPATASDPDAYAFLSAASISDLTQSDAVDALVIDLKAAGIWTKIRALWPMVGGTASTHKFNLKDPRDVDAAFRLTFTGGWTHDLNGVLPDGSTGYANTHLNPAVDLDVASGSVGLYCRTTSPGTGQPYDMGCDDGDTNPVIVLAAYSNNVSYQCYGSSSFTPSAANTDALGMWATNRLDSAEVLTRGFHDGASFASASVSVTLPNRDIYLGCNNRAGTATYFSAKQQALAFASDGLTAAEHSDFYDAVQTFQTSLGRNV